AIFDLGDIMARPKAEDKSILSMALVGYEMEKRRIEEKIQEIRTQLGKVTARVARAITPDAPKRRKLSAAARKRIAAAQKKRWAEHRKAAAQATKNQAKSEAR